MATLKKGIIGSCMIMLASCMTMQPQQLSNNGVTNHTKTPAASDAKIIFQKTAPQPDHWYLCDVNNQKISFEGGAAKISFTNTMGGCFGIWFDPIDVTKTPKISVKSSFTASSVAKQIDVLVSLTDVQKNKLYIPAKIKLLEDNKGLIEYIFDYEKEIKEKSIKFDYSKVNSILFFINITGVKDASGFLSIEEITLNSILK